MTNRLQAVLLILSPFIIYYLNLSVGYYPAFIFLVVVMLFNIIPRIIQNRRLTISFGLKAGAIGLYLILGSFVSNILVIKLFPVFINFVLLSSFAYSLAFPPTMVEGFAVLEKGRPLVDDEVKYCVKVTAIWSGFFFVDLLLVAYVAIFRPFHEWVILTGFINYILIGLLFCGEYIYRKYKFKDFQKERVQDRVLLKLFELGKPHTKY